MEFWSGTQTELSLDDAKRQSMLQGFNVTAGPHTKKSHSASEGPGTQRSTCKCCRKWRKLKRGKPTDRRIVGRCVEMLCRDKGY